MAKKRGNPENLIPFNQLTEKEQKKIASNGGKKSVEVRRKKKLMSQIYTEALAKKFKVKDENGKEKEVDGEVFLADVIQEVISKKDRVSVSMMKEIRQATEGIKLRGVFDVNTYDVPLTPEQDKRYREKMSEFFGVEMTLEDIENEE